MTAERLFVSVAEAADRLGISADLAYDLIHRGELPANRFGRRLIVPVRAIARIEEAAVDGFDPTSTLAAAGGARAAPGA